MDLAMDLATTDLATTDMATSGANLTLGTGGALTRLPQGWGPGMGAPRYTTSVILLVKSGKCVYDNHV